MNQQTKSNIDLTNKSSSVALTDSDVEAAAARLKGVVRRTPILESPLLNAAIGGRLLIKAESLQHMGSIKYRGATNAIGKAVEKSPGCAIVAASSGNHACAVSAVARRYGVDATVIVPQDAPAMKVAVSEHFGARVVLRKLPACRRGPTP